MQSITYYAAGHTGKPRPAPTPTPAPATGHHGLVVNVGSVHLPVTWGTALLLGIGLLCVFADQAGKSKRSGAATDKAVGEAIIGTAKAVWTLLRFLARLLGGLPLRASAERSDATWTRPGAAPAPARVKVEMASLAAPVNLRKGPGPRPWVRGLVRSVTGYNGRAAWVLSCLVWCFRALLWTGRLLRTVHRAVWPVLALCARLLRAWGRWPYLARAGARVALLGALVGLAVPAWRGWTIAALSVVLAALAAIAAKVAHRSARQAGDDEVYGPRIWAVLRDDLGLADDELREDWLLLPASLSAPDARIVIRLPWTWRGGEADRLNLTSLVNSRVPGDWVPRITLTDKTFTAVYTHRPPPAPKPECPARVDFFADDIQAAIAECKVGEVVLGKDENGRIIVRRLDGETPHWALSVGTGGGKSAFNSMIAVQLIAQGYTIVGVDVKRSSLKQIEGIPGVHIYKDPKNIQDMRNAVAWWLAEVEARSFVKDKEPDTEFPGLLLLLEESNELADQSKEWWDEHRKPTSDKDGPADKAADPMWGDVASGARLGRFVRGNILAVFQDLRDQALGGKGIRNLFRFKLMGNYSVNSWKNVVGTTPVPDSVDLAGRMMMIEGNAHVWVQTLFGGDGNELREWALAAREAQGFDPAAGLFGTPPERSPERKPWLLRLLSRDADRRAAMGLSGAVWGDEDDETAGELSPGDADVTAPRDRLRLIPGQAGGEAPSDPSAAPQLLNLAEVVRELNALGYDLKENTVRKHKTRRNDNGFPEGITVEGVEKWVISQIIHFYEGRGITPDAAAE